MLKEKLMKEFDQELEKKKPFDMKEILKNYDEKAAVKEFQHVVMMAVATKKKPWWPGTIELQKSWFANYALHLPDYTAALSLTVPELDQVAKDAAIFKYLFDQDDESLSYKAELMAYRVKILFSKEQIAGGAVPTFTVITIPPLVLTGLLTRQFNFIKGLKTRSGMTSIIRTALRIDGADLEPFDPDTYVANGKAKVFYDKVRIRYTKGPYIQGMGIFIQRKPTEEFKLLKKVTKVFWDYKEANPVFDVPELLSFKTQAMLGDEFVGEPSPPFSVTWLAPPPIEE